MLLVYCCVPGSGHVKEHRGGRYPDAMRANVTNPTVESEIMFCFFCFFVKSSVSLKRSSQRPRRTGALYFTLVDVTGSGALAYWFLFCGMLPSL